MSKPKNTALEVATWGEVLFNSMKTTTTTLPEAVHRYFEATNRFDAEAAAACFTPEAIVRDEGKTHVGTDEIRNWVSHSSKEYQPRASVLGAEQKGDVLAVAVSVAGQFPGSPVELDFEFSLRDEKIAELAVH
ncbi:polyketide cyclase [Verrucomicrobia bacterium LW23]|nr:polyketide cyclase [Verrucomicrobia bacterium LW23]